jgi:DNA mismatch repair ATPase MutS
MTSENNPSSYYESRLSTLDQKMSELKRIAHMWIALRLTAFSIVPITLYFFYNIGPVIVTIVVAELIVFLFFVRKSAENREEINFVKNLIFINREELNALNGDYSAFGNGEEWKNPKHAFTYDFDIFGEQSIFQYLNRSATKNGAELLAQVLQEGVSTIQESQEAIEELCAHQDWSQRFRARGMENEKESPLRPSISKWGATEISYPSVYKILRYLLPVLGFTLFGAYYFDILSGVEFVVYSIPVMLPIMHRVKKTNKLSHEMEALEKTVTAMQHQLAIMEEVKFTSQELTQLQAELLQSNINASAELKELASYCKRIGQRNNVLVGILLNYFLAWDIQLTVQVDQWKSRNVEFLASWETALYKMEVFISGANFRINNYCSTTYPRITESTAEAIHIKNLGHPLINEKVRVSNDFELKSTEQFAIITGPNMAGKSTFLRSVGVNLMLAKAGFSVMAKTFHFPDVLLYSSMRTSDDLNADTSYFHAELLRLRFIADAIEKRKESVFIVLDEILKGTNSKDKEEGSALFLKKLCDLGAKGIIATHDLKLTELSTADSRLINLYFDSTISGDHMDFDYKIREGVAQNMNASFLLKRMGLT